MNFTKDEVKYILLSTRFKIDVDEYNLKVDNNETFKLQYLHFISYQGGYQLYNVQKCIYYKNLYDVYSNTCGLLRQNTFVYDFYNMDEIIENNDINKLIAFLILTSPDIGYYNIKTNEYDMHTQLYNSKIHIDRLKNHINNKLPLQFFYSHYFISLNMVDDIYKLQNLRTFLTQADIKQINLQKVLEII